MSESVLPLVPTTACSPLDVGDPIERLTAAFLSGRSVETLRAYRCDLQDFAESLGVDLAGGVRRLLAAGNGPANALVLAYRTDLLDRAMAAATVNRRLAALRSVVKLARTLGMVAWSLDIAGVPSESYRDVRGPGKDGFRQMLAMASKRTDAKGLRDVAILRLLYDLGLRRKEAIGLDWPGDVDLDSPAVFVLGKGRFEKVRLTLPRPTAGAIRAWLALRGPEPGPLFRGLGRGGTGGRLTGTAVYQMVRDLGERVGLKTRPHALRHLAITEALDMTGGDVRSVQKFSRHKNVQTLLKYDDSRVDSAGELARRLAEDSP